MVDRSTMIGLILTVALLAGVMVIGTGLSVHVFWQASSLVLVLGGAVLTTVMSSPEARLQQVRGMLRSAFYVQTRPVEDVIVTLVALAEIARRQGLLALDRPVAGLRDGFIKRAIHMAIDGYEPGSIRATLQAELESIDLRHRENWSMLESVGRSAPTFGMMGTLIGLVVMLGKMDDPSKIGPGMAVALLTTLYGLVIANVFCLPLARKLSHRNSEELLAKTVAVEGVLAIQAGEHPRVLAHRLEAYLPPGRRSLRMSGLTAPRETDWMPDRKPAGSAAAAVRARKSSTEAAADRSGPVPGGRTVSPMPPATAGVSPLRSGHKNRRDLVEAV